HREPARHDDRSDPCRRQPSGGGEVPDRDHVPHRLRHGARHGERGAAELSSTVQLESPVPLPARQGALMGARRHLPQSEGIDLMTPIVFALRRPLTIMVLVAAVALASLVAVARTSIDFFPNVHLPPWLERVVTGLPFRMSVDIFPNLNLPVIYVAQPYGGMDPAQMEGLLTNYYEYHFLYIGGIHHVESKNVQGMALMKLFFHPGTDMSQAMAETIGYVTRSRAFMPPGTVSPFIMRFDVGSIPVGYLVLRSDTKSIGEIQDQALFKVRPMF